MNSKTYQLNVTQADYAALMFGLTVAITDIEANAAGMHADDADLAETQRAHVATLRSLQQRLSAQYGKQQEASR